MEEAAHVLDELSRKVERVKTSLFAGGFALILVAILGTAVTKSPAFCRACRSGCIAAGAAARISGPIDSPAGTVPGIIVHKLLRENVTRSRVFGGVMTVDRASRITRA